MSSTTSPARTPDGTESTDERAVRKLVSQMIDKKRDEAIPAGRALWKLVRGVGRPQAQDKRAKVAAQLQVLLPEKLPVRVRRELLWMLSEIGGDESVGAVAAWLQDVEMREDARMVLERIPGEQSLATLRTALETVPDHFKFSIAHSLRVRGEVVEGYPSKKLVPTKKTGVRESR